MKSKLQHVGVLALQGDFAVHMNVLHSMGMEALAVRTLADLERCDRLILPGGESTVIARLLRSSGLWDPILTKARESMPIFGTCAGAILLASEVTGVHPPETFRLLDITIDRNAYGAQVQSFVAPVTIEDVGTVNVSFIRAPKITRVGAGVEVLAAHNGDPVFVRQGSFLAATFHPEVHGECGIHEMFLHM